MFTTLYTTFLNLVAQVTRFRQLVLLQMRSSLRSGHLSLKVPFLEVHFIKLVIRNIPTQTTATALGIISRPIPIIHEALGLLTSSDGALVAPKPLLFPVRLLHLLAFGVLVTVAALPFLFLLIALQELVLLNLVNRVVAILLHLLSVRPVRLIIFNQNCLSLNCIFFRCLLVYCCLICGFCLWSCSIALFHGSFVLPLLRLTTGGLLLAGRICLDVVLT